MLHIDVKRIRRLKMLLEQMSHYIITTNLTKTAIAGLPEKTKLFIQLFDLHKKINVVKFKHIFGSKNLDDLLKLNLLVITGKNITCNYSIKAINDYYFVHEPETGKKLEYGYLAKDSFILARNLPLNFRATKALDLCTGTGIQAILLAKRSKKIVGVELSPEVTNLARFNVILNQLENKVKILQGDLYDPVKNMKFDLIVANPPYIPVPDKLRYPLCGKGGEDGLLILKKIFDHLSNYLTKNGTGLILGITYGDRTSPFVLELLREIAKRDKLDTDVFVLERTPSWREILNRSRVLSNLNPNSALDPRVEMARVYNQAKAEYLYTYLVKIRRGKANVKLTSLFAKKGGKREVKISANTSLRSLRFQFVESFMDGQYSKAIEIHKNMQKFRKLFRLKFGGNAFFILGACYEKLRRYRKAITELKKAQEVNPEEDKINLSLARCYRKLGQIKQADKELEKAAPKLKKSKQRFTKELYLFNYFKNNF